MSNPFHDQSHFMTACGQTVDEYNSKQFNLYCDLIREEVGELNAAKSVGDKVECLDALVDILVVTIGAIHSMGADAQGAWNEVVRSNMSKIDPATRKVIKRDDGKILKPANWSPPDLSKYVD